MCQVFRLVSSPGSPADGVWGESVYAEEGALMPPRGAVATASRALSLLWGTSPACAISSTRSAMIVGSLDAGLARRSLTSSAPCGPGRRGRDGP